MTREVQARAQQLLVHSRHQAEVLRLERPREAAPAEIVPHGIPAVSGNGAGAAGGPTIVCIGDPSSRLREALARVRESQPGARLEILGEGASPAGAGLAVELRGDPAGGSASAEVCDCIGAGIPVIVSDSGWGSELPEPVVLPVPADCSAIVLAERMTAALSDETLRAEVRSAQEAYAEEHSFARVAERYAELLGL
jgi:hypothetical protein